VIEKVLPRGAKLDGHDSGLGEFNVFVHTNEPVAVFQPISELIRRLHPGITFSAAYRDFTEDDYTVLWPPSLTKFVVS
jgi:hypothetical protein